MPLNQDPVPPSGCGSRHVPRASGRRCGRHRSSSWEVLLHLFPRALEEDSPEEAFAAFTGHGVEVKACGSVSAYPTDAGHIPVKVAKVRQRGASCHCLHPTRRADRPRPELEAVLGPVGTFCTHPHLPGCSAKPGSSPGPRPEQDFFGTSVPQLPLLTILGHEP